MNKAALFPPILGLRNAPLEPLQGLLQCLADRGLRCGVVQLAADDFDPDIPGKDSYTLRHAGVSQLLLASEYKSALLQEYSPQLPSLQGCLAQLVLEELDLVLCLDPPAHWLAPTQQLSWPPAVSPADLADTIQSIYLSPESGDPSP